MGIQRQLGIRPWRRCCSYTAYCRVFGSTGSDITNADSHPKRTMSSHPRAHHVSLNGMAAHVVEGTVGVKGSSPNRYHRFQMVRSRGLEPPRVAPLAPQASASTSSATTASGTTPGPGAEASRQRRACNKSPTAGQGPQIAPDRLNITYRPPPHGKAVSQRTQKRRPPAHPYQVSRCMTSAAYTLAASAVRSTEAMSRSVWANAASPGP